MDTKLSQETVEVMLELLGYVTVRPTEADCDLKWERARTAAKEVEAYHAELRVIADQKEKKEEDGNS